MLGREAASSAFLRLPPRLQRATLHALGKRAPWEAGFDHRAPAVAANLLIGPPDFVGVGVQKAGTTWWFGLLAQHPGIYQHGAFHKERHYFGQFAVRDFSESDAGEYHRWFPRPAGLSTGEWTPDYLHYHWMAPMLQRAAPEAKLLVLLRDPVARLRSGLDHHRQRGEAITPMVVSDAFARGLYAQQLSRLARTFPPGQVLVLQYEACIDDPRKSLAATFRFLGVDDSFVPVDAGRELNRTTVPPQALPDDRVAELAELYQADLHSLAGAYPDLDLDRWPTFARKAGRVRPR